MNATLRPALVIAAILLAAPGYAQLNGENLLGDMGVKSGTQPDPGIYVGNLYYRYFTDSIKGPDGTSVVFDPTASGSQTIHATVPMVIYVSPRKILGANYGAMAVMPFATASLEAPGLGLSEEASIGPSDMYIMPIQLGWRSQRADAIAGFAFFSPTGRHTAGASDNLGKGMWSYEVSGGTTVYADDERSFSIATTAFWELHSNKDGEVRVENITITDVKVGQLLTLEGGVGKSFLGGAASVGAAYYAQWKLTSDELRFVAGPISPSVGAADKHRVFGIGPDVTVPIATRTRLIALVNVRYLWETGTQSKTQGNSLVVNTTFPVPSIRIPD